MPPPSGGAGGSLSAEMASAGRRLRMAMATNPEALPGTLLVENTRVPLPHSGFDHNIFTSPSVVTFESSTSDADLRTLYVHNDRGRLFLPLGS